MKALFAFTAGLPGLVLGRDVLKRPLYPHDAALGVAHRLPGGAHPEVPTRQCDKFGLQVKRCAVADAALKRCLHGLPVRGQVQLHDLFHRAHTPRNAEGGGDLLRPVQLQAGQLHDPAANAGHLPGHAQGLALGQQLGVHLVALLHQVGQHLLLAAQFQLHHRLLGQYAQAFQLLGLDVPGDGVQHRQRAQRLPLGGDQRHTGVKAHMGVLRDQRVVGKNRVLVRVVDHHGLAAAAQCMRAERNRALGLLERYTHCGLEPLPVAVHEVDHRHGALAYTRSQRGQLVKAVFRRGVEDRVRLQRLEPCGLCGGLRWWHGQSTVAPLRTQLPSLVSATKPWVAGRSSVGKAIGQ